MFINPEEDLRLMRNLISRFVKNDEGAALVEYGMLVGLIAVACVVAVGTLGATISGYFDTINASL
jgi:pilus assembly protein Flp/PilA